MERIKKMDEYLTGEKIEEIKQDPINQLSIIAKKLGYTAVAREIKHNRRAKDNLLYVIKGLDKKYTNLTEEKQELLETVINKLYNLSDLLKSNSKEQLTYLKLKRDYNNATFELAEAYKELNFLEARSEQWRKCHCKIEQLHFDFKEAENKLDDFVLNII